MITFWDTSAAINAAVNPEVYARLDEGEHVGRTHLLAEFFSRMTGYGIKVIDDEGETSMVSFSPNEAAAWLKDFAPKLKWIELDCAETLKAIAKAQSMNVQGGKVYDYLHVVAAAKVGATKILTRNVRDFAPLAGNIAVEWP